MTDISIKQMPAFKNAYKRLHILKRNKVDDAIREIVSDPNLGIPKKGDLAGVYVYKFKIDHQEFLLAYEWDPAESLLLALGVHENFYRDLKKKKS